jgi:hypothetical protein
VSLATHSRLMGILAIASGNDYEFGREFANVALWSGYLGICCECLKRCSDNAKPDCDPSASVDSRSDIVAYICVLSQVIDFMPAGCEESFRILEICTVEQLIEETLNERILKQTDGNLVLLIHPVEELCAAILAAALAHGDSVCSDDLTEAWISCIITTFTASQTRKMEEFDNEILCPMTMVRNLLIIVMMLQQRRSIDIDSRVGLFPNLWVHREAENDGVSVPETLFASQLETSSPV